MLPCFATGCHSFNFKIATAATRPRNDMKIGTFLFGKRTFLLLCVLFSRCRSAAFFRCFVPKIVPFSRKTDQFCHCEERSDAAIFNVAICHPETNYGRAERNRALKQRKRKRNETAKLLFFIGIPFCFALPCFATGCHSFNFKIAPAATRPRNDTENETFLLVTQGF